MHKTPIFILLFLSGPAFGGTAKLAITADVGICAHRAEVSLNTGGRSRVRIKGNEHYYLFDFDVRAIRSCRITAAALHLKLSQWAFAAGGGVRPDGIGGLLYYRPQEKPVGKRRLDVYDSIPWAILRHDIYQDRCVTPSYRR